MVSFTRDSNICTVCISDSTVMTRLDKLVESDKAPHWKLKEEHRLHNGELIGENMNQLGFNLNFRKKNLT